MTMAGTLYSAYLLALLIGPLLVMWRWGLAAALAVTVAEVALLVLVWAYALPPSFHPVGYPIEPGESPLVQIRRSQANAYLMLVVWVLLPAIAALVGGGLSVAWWATLAVWRGWVSREAA